MSALTDVLDALARAVDDLAPDDVSLGEIRLRPHQTSGARAIAAAITEFGGALLADDPGLGKTFTALAVARRYDDALIAAPASLREMWRGALASTRVPARFISLEALSRGSIVTPAPLLVIDEAHHAASTSAVRYGALARLAEPAHVVLLTATPIRNRRAELDTLLGLFLGTRASALDDAALARCVVRRSAGRLTDLPTIHRHAVPPPPRTPRIARQLIDLPPPFPVADGVAAAALVANGLARCWGSSLAALERALTRRLQRGAAIHDMLASGRHPTRADLRAWIVGDDSTQLALPFPCGDSDSDRRGQLAVLDAHLTAVKILRDSVRPRVADDTAWRAERLASIARDHAGAPVIAFTAFEATATALFRALVVHPGTVLLTSRGARSAGGAIPRNDVVRLLGPDGDATRPDSARFDPRLIVATDVVSEGVNLQRASAVVHLDEPWTPAAVAQRTGRIARIGSRNSRVTEYRFAAPAAAARILRTSQIHRRKLDSAQLAMGPSNARDALRDICAAWIEPVPVTAPSVVASARSTTHGFIARIQSPARAWLVAGRRDDDGVWRLTQTPAQLLRLARTVSIEEATLPRKDEITTIGGLIHRWIDRSQSAGMAGADRAPSGAVRRALIRLDRLVDLSPTTARPALATRVGRLRALLLAATGAAAELHVSAMLSRPANVADWLESFEERLRRAVSSRTVGGERPVLAALLVLRPAPRSP